MSLSRVLVVETETLLGAGVEKLLTHKANLEVVAVSPGDEAELLCEIRRFRPDVIVLDETDGFVSLTQLMDSLRDCPRMRVVAISSGDTQAQVYDKLKVPITGVTDFFAVLGPESQVGQEIVHPSVTNC